eukprot:CAMPEP_0170409206 /NCGR_PEP_ID=MMETSP0117_2-20130122/29215_1 /TAXON_ID=400756 /ORGANISM="Durinskia baltica, Strain CSIRO CS-38" /LENGTH=71 /DNA_ID=CAMNT_0010666621 /DNA_START=30 /DNA_END=241 /DNA_ORIENTATION=-
MTRSVLADPHGEAVCTYAEPDRPPRRLTWVGRRGRKRRAALPSSTPAVGPRPRGDLIRPRTQEQAAPWKSA